MTLNEQALYAIEVINNSKSLEIMFKDEFPNNTIGQVYDTLKYGLLSIENQEKVVTICPVCFEINGKIFLMGETKGEHDLIGDEMDYQPLTELFDMTTEIENGNSYSFYVSDVRHFKLAEPIDTIKVHKFLRSLK